MPIPDADLRLKDAVVRTPRVFDSDAAARFKDALGDRLVGIDATVAELIIAVAACSPYLSRLMIASGDGLPDLLSAPIAKTLDDAKARASSVATSADDKMRELRGAKRDVAIALALAEIGGALSTLDAAAALSRFADAALTGACRTALSGLQSRGFAPVDADAPECDSGLVFLAMGKLGAHELNYSSDIDLIALFDPSAPALGGETAREIAVAATKEIVRIMQTQTADGYVFRTDLRLRPDPGVSAAAVSINAAETYYEAHGQNWERAAFIKARAAAGDVALGERFINSLRPFVWRKYLDFAAIEDVLSIKRQIHAAKGGGVIEFAGHDLKTGRGGIREIEFLAQTQQLILGGKNARHRSRSTVEALATLAEDGRISAAAARELTSHYTYLRMVEHRIQMIADEQTHKIPTSDRDIARLAAFLGEDDAGALEVKIRSVLEQTHGHFSELFGREERLSAAAGSLSFTGVENNPETLATLLAMGFARADAVSDTLRRWHAGGARATRSIRARELLTALTPRLLESLARAGDPDEAFSAFAAFIERLPAGVQIFALFVNNPGVFDRLTQIMTIAPYLGRALAKRRHLVEAVIEGAWPPQLDDEHALPDAIARAIGEETAFEDALNAARRWASEQKFLTATLLVLDAMTPAAAGRRFSAIADATIAALLPAARRELVRQHGEIEGAIAVIGLGRLGQQAMTATSDIDLIFIYDAPSDAVSDGPKPLDGVSWFTRLVRRLVTALSAVTEEGGLYEVDMQLRPSGRSGPAAVSKRAFVRYFEEDAWTWEVMALTKARAIAGDSALCAFVQAEIDRIIARAPARPTLRDDVREMRARVRAAKPSASPWDLKYADGGIGDFEFLEQFAQLSDGKRRDLAALSRHEGFALDESTVAILLTAREFFETIVQLSRASVGESFNPAGAGLALNARMSQACKVASIDEAEALIRRKRRQVLGAYERFVGLSPEERG
ncbi:MAG: bifunctional [glutamine synthetase] adenylyltransferase/[glutamine synthetase]-adenylyl-L-tyrosine phosphorylase [Pseudomonadota bacterium]